jgi:PAS domain S-box-containing protein
MNDSSKTRDKKQRKPKEQKSYVRTPAAPEITEACANSLNFHAQLLDAIEQAVIATDLDGIVIYWNHFAHELYGWTPDEAIGRNIMELTTPDATLKQAEEIMSQLRRGQSWTGEFIVKRKDGTTFPVQITNSPIFDNEKTLCGIVGISNDIADRKRNEQALRESESKYRALVEQASDGIHTYDFQGNFIETNSKLCEMLGYTAEELLQLNVKDLVLPEDLVENPIRFSELRSGKTVLNERRLRHKDGTLIPVEVSGRMIQEGVLQAIIRDITERKHAEEKLKQSEEWLRTILEASLDGILVEDNEKIIYVNQSYAQLFGYDSPNELIGQSVSVVISSEDAERVMGFGKARLRGEQPPKKYEFKGKRKDGTSIDVEASVSTSTAADHTHITTIIRDITERKRTQEALLNSEKQLRLITDANPLLISYVDREHRYRLVNRTYTDWFERSREEIIGKHLSEVLGQAAYQAILPEIEKVLSGEEVIFERLVPYKSGERYIHVHYVPEVDASSKQVIGFHAFVQDISERKRAEIALQRSREELEFRVQQRTKELEYANKAIRVEMMERGKAEESRLKMLHRLVTVQEDERRRFARNLHDQLGQQLTALRLKLEVLKKMCDGNQELYNQVAETQNVARRLDLDVEFLAWQLRPTVLDDLGIVAALDNYAQQWSINFKIATYFNADRFGKTSLSPETETNLYHIAQEALNNIAKHAQASKVNILLEPRDDFVVLIIEDNGVGFDSDKQALNGQQTKGLGLIGMHERVWLVGGALEIESTLGEGTTVYAKVPIYIRRKGEI